MSELVDKVADELMKTSCQRVFGHLPTPWQGLHECTRQKWREDARAALKVVEDFFWAEIKKSEFSSDAHAMGCAAETIKDELDDR